MTGLSQHNHDSFVGTKRTPLTKHAAVRCQQRSVPHAVIDALIDFGETQHDSQGAVRHFFSKRAWRLYSAYLGTESKHYDRYRSAYAVIAEDGSVITTGWRH
ncbi:hypothetical protein [Sphingobium naphthae]|uniref:DUF4258 domain-containing protein n=1 Tax=Sphingobium naphthae TaxID=1886786 RepID=A0ABU3ZXQ8_9SPHN|nr:hypothetical protein [Sphingobium naphthae]MDV5824310.1 hypothetical protein [Sphingobium naphthae]